MKSLLSLVISLNLIISPFAMAIERENLVGIDETTESFIDAVEREKAADSAARTRSAGPRTSTGVPIYPSSSRGSRSSGSGSAGSTSSTAQKRECAPGEIYNTYSEKCMGSEESRILNAEADQECNVLTDPELRASCVKSRVTEKTTRAEKNGDMKKHSDKLGKIDFIPIVLAFTTLSAAILHLTTRGPGCPGASSSYMMIAGSVAIIATEIMTKNTYKKELDKSHKELNEIIKSSNSASSDNKNATDLQVAVFEALIKNENGVIKAAEGKKKGYTLAALMYAGAAIAAGFEIAAYIAESATGIGAVAAAAKFICKDAVVSKNGIMPEGSQEVYSYLNFLEKSDSRITFSNYIRNSLPKELTTPVDFKADILDRARFASGELASLHLDDYRNIKLDIEKSKNDFEILTKAISALRELVIPTSHAVLADYVALDLAKSQAVKKFFLMPATRLALAGMMTGVTVTLGAHASKEIKKAKDRIVVLEKLKSQVSEAGPAVKCANGTEQGTSGCKQVVPTTIKPGESTFGLAATQANGSARTAARSPFAARGCANAKGDGDPECGCKKTNSCFSMNSNFKIGNTGAGNILGTGINDLNALTSGNISPSDLNVDALGKQLAAAGKMRDKMLADLNKDPKIASEIKKAQESLNGLQRQIYNSMPANSSGVAQGLALSNDSDLSGLSGNQVLEQVKEELKEASAPKVTNEAVAGSGESDFNFDIGTADPMNVGTGLTEGEGNANTNIDDFELAESEINPSSTTNIFEILSSRYKKSAYMRLLKADKEIAPEAPAEKEIND